MGEGQKATALVVTTLATHDASTAACLHTTPLPDPSNIHHHPSDSKVLSLRQRPQLMRIYQLELGALIKGCVSAHQPGAHAEQLQVCPVHVSAFTILESFLQLFFPTVEVKLENLADPWLLSTHVKRHNTLIL